MKMPKEIGIDPTPLLVEGRVRLAQLLYVHEHHLLVGVLKIGIGSNVGTDMWYLCYIWCFTQV